MNERARNYGGGVQELPVGFADLRSKVEAFGETAELIVPEIDIATKIAGQRKLPDIESPHVYEKVVSRGAIPKKPNENKDVSDTTVVDIEDKGNWQGSLKDNFKDLGKGDM
jgi:hypothetical protein